MTAARLEEPDAVHAMRSATRRVRSALRSTGSFTAAVRWAGSRRAEFQVAAAGFWHAAGTPKSCWTGCARMPEARQGEAADDVQRRVERELGIRLDAGYRKTQEVLRPTATSVSLTTSRTSVTTRPCGQPRRRLRARPPASLWAGRPNGCAAPTRRRRGQRTEPAKSRAWSSKSPRRRKRRCTRCGRMPSGASRGRDCRPRLRQARGTARQGRAQAAEDPR